MQSAAQACHRRQQQPGLPPQSSPARRSCSRGSQQPLRHHNRSEAGPKHIKPCHHRPCPAQRPTPEAPRRGGLPACGSQGLDEHCVIQGDPCWDLNQVDNGHDGVVRKAPVLEDDAKYRPIRAVVPRHVVLPRANAAALACKVDLAAHCPAHPLWGRITSLHAADKLVPHDAVKAWMAYWLGSKETKISYHGQQNDDRLALPRQIAPHVTGERNVFRH